MIVPKGHVISGICPLLLSLRSILGLNEICKYSQKTIFCWQAEIVKSHEQLPPDAFPAFTLGCLATLDQHYRAGTEQFLGAASLILDEITSVSQLRFLPHSSDDRRQVDSDSGSLKEAVAQPR